MTSETKSKVKELSQYMIPVIPFSNFIAHQAKGAFVFDGEGRRLLDINGGQFCSVLGHSNAEVTKYILESLQTIQHTNTSMLSQTVLEASQAINRISGEMDARSIFLSTGSEAIEFCLRYAKHITGKEGVICFDKGYHGLSLGSQSITYGGQYTRPPVTQTYNIPIPPGTSSQNDMDNILDNFERLLRNHNIAVAMFEPIVSVGGMVFPPPYFFKKIRRLCSQYSTLLAFDECQTGFGRTGSWFYYQQIECLPDMVVCAKGMGLGFPVSVVMFTKEIVPQEGFSLTHYSSHQNDPLPCAAVLAGIGYIEKHQLLNRVKDYGHRFLCQLQLLTDDCSSLTNPRGAGLMLGADLKIEGVSDYRKLYGKLVAAAEQKGLLLQGCNGGKTLRFLPSYLIEEHEIELCMATLSSVFTEMDLTDL